MSLESSMPWVRNTLIPRMVKSVPGWNNSQISGCKVTPMSEFGDGFASLLFSVDLCLEHAGKQESYALIVKIMLNDPELRAELQSEKQFANEILAYSKLMPLFETISGSRVIIESLSPNFYYSSSAPRAESGECNEEDGVLVLENLKPKGFRLGDRISLDLDHTVLALQQLGRFHALSYALKTLNKKALFQIVPEIHETFHTNDWCNANKTFHVRVTDALKKLSPEDDFGEKLTAKISDPTYFDWLKTPKEPLAVVCHGDFCRNNILFSYDEDNKPCEVKFLDFQTIRYASPVIDISFFLFMNTTAELRAQHWDHLLESYNQAVRQTLAGLLGQPIESLDPCYSLEAFKEEFRKHAVYGYCISLTFLPTMIADDQDRQEYVRVWNEAGSAFSPEAMVLLIALGGERVTHALVALAQHIKHLGCL